MTIIETVTRRCTAAHIPVASPARHGRAEGGQGNPSGAQGAALTFPLPVAGAGATIRRLAMVIATTSLVIIALAAPSFALELKSLRAGAYVPADTTCEGVGGASQMSFDGANFSGHYQLCRTDRLGGDRYRSTCVEAQGPDWPKLQDIDKDPGRTSADATIVVKSPTSFSYDGQTYRYCGAP